jgi:hypothetical protein
MGPLGHSGKPQREVLTTILVPLDASEVAKYVYKLKTSSKQVAIDPARAPIVSPLISVTRVDESHFGSTFTENQLDSTISHLYIRLSADIASCWIPCQHLGLQVEVRLSSPICHRS